MCVSNKTSDDKVHLINNALPISSKETNRPSATNDHMVQNPPCWRANSLLFPHWDIKTKRPVLKKLDLPLFWCPSAGIIMSLPSSMADFVSCDRLLQKVFRTYNGYPWSKCLWAHLSAYISFLKACLVSWVHRNKASFLSKWESCVWP